MTRQEVPSSIPILGLVRPLAAMAIVAAVLGRALGPSAAGVGVGMARLSGGLEFAGNLASQMFAMLATVVAIGEILATTRSRLGLHVRVMAVVLGGVVLLIALTAAAVRVRDPSAAVIAFSAASV